MFFKPENRDLEKLPHDPVKAIVAPRPIGWISTVSTQGVANLSPYSFFNAVGGNPPLVMFSSEGVKDSARNAIETGEFVYNHVSERLDEVMNATSMPCPADVDEFEALGVEKADCKTVSAPRVAMAHAALECKVTSVKELEDLSGEKTGAVMVIGQVTGIHVDPAVIRDGRFDVTLAKPVTRLGYFDFARLGEVYERLRPMWNGERHNP